MVKFLELNIYGCSCELKRHMFLTWVVFSSLGVHAMKGVLVELRSHSHTHGTRAAVHLPLSEDGNKSNFQSTWFLH